MAIASHWLVRAEDSTPRRFSIVNSTAKTTFHSAGGISGRKLAAAELHQIDIKTVLFKDALFLRNPRVGQRRHLQHADLDWDGLWRLLRRRRSHHANRHNSRTGSDREDRSRMSLDH